MTQATTTKGHWYGHLFRRMIHVSMIFVPSLYTDFLIPVAAYIRLTPTILLMALSLVVLICEGLRLLSGFVVFGQRKHEARRLSSFTWGWLGLVAVLLCSPSMGFASAIIWSLALGDPCLGEGRRYFSKPAYAFMLGLLVIGLIWFYSAIYFGFSPVWLLFMAPLTVLAEWKSFRWIDDNVLMLVIPLLAVLIGVKF
jgi:hypothetical protein